MKITSNTIYKYTTILIHLPAIVFSVLIGYDLYHQSQYYPELGYDESASFLGKQLLMGKYGNTIDPIGPGYTRYFRMDCYPPVYYIFSAVVFKLMGFGIVQARLVSVLFIISTMLLCYIVSLRFMNPFAGLCAVLAYSYIPNHVYEVHARPDVAVPFFLLVSVYASLEASRYNKNWIWFLSGASLSLAVFSHFVGLMVIPALSILLGYLMGFKFFKKKSFYSYLSGFLLICLIYAAFMYPYLYATFKHLISYSASAGIENQGSIIERWPIKAFRMHYEYLLSYRPYLLYSFWVSTFLLMGSCLCFFNTRVNCYVIIFLFLFWSTFLLIGIYPNIGFAYGYYAPCYLIFWAMSIGFISGFLWNKLSKLRIYFYIFIFVLGGMIYYYFHTVISYHINGYVKHIPLASSIDWIQKFYDKDYPTIAVPHWIYAVPHDDIITPRVFSYDKNKNVEVAPDFKIVSSFPHSTSDYDVIIADQYQELMNVNVLNLDSRSPIIDLSLKNFEIIGIMRDACRISSNYSILKRSDIHPHDSIWPRMALSFPEGPVEFFVNDKLIRTLSIKKPLEPINPKVWGLFFELSIPKLIQSRPILCRFVIESTVEKIQSEISGFVMFNSDIVRHNPVETDLINKRTVYVVQNDAIGLFGYKLLNGENGRDLLISTQKEKTSALSIYSFHPVELKRIDVVLPLKKDGKITSDLIDSLNQLSGSIQIKSNLFIVEFPSKIFVGETTNVLLSKECFQARIVVWQHGKPIDQYVYNHVNQCGFQFKKKGNYGIEVWLKDKENEQESVTAFQLIVE